MLVVLLMAICLRALAALIMCDGAISAAPDKLDRGTVELVTVSVSDAHRTSPRTQLRANDAKLAREVISFIDRVFCICEDHSALVLDVCADDEIKMKYGIRAETSALRA